MHFPKKWINVLGGYNTRSCMSPFSDLLKSLRLSRELRQSELAALIGYEQSYLSALELGIKGPPTNEFVERLVTVLRLTEVEQIPLMESVAASNRKIQVPPEAPPEVFWLCHKLRQQIDHLHPAQITLISTALDLPLGRNSVVTQLPARIRGRHSHQEAIKM